MKDAVRDSIPDPNLTDAQRKEREEGRRKADAFRETLSPAEERRFDQEKAITQRQEEWRLRAPSENRDTSERMQAKMAAELKDLWSGKKIAIRVTPQSLEQIIDDGRFKSSHETGYSSGWNNQEARADLEQQLWGIDPESERVQQRPIYGYVAVNGIRRQALDSALGQYGSVQVVFKDAVRKRTTASNGDSMSRRNDVRPSPVDAPEHWSYTTRGQAPGQYQVDGQKLMNSGYAEAQIHGGVTLDDIEEVILSRDPDESLRERLEDKGLSWRVVN